MFLIKWRTNEPSTGAVVFALTETGLASGIRISKSQTVKQHAISLSGLEPGMTYFYQVLSVDSEKNGPTISGVKTFSTRAGADKKPPKVVSGPSVVDKTTTSALFEWETDEPATSEVEVNGIRSSRSEGAQKHRVQVTGLSPETTYSFVVISTDAAGFTVEVAGSPFTTPALPDIIPPEVLEGPGITYKSDTQVTVSWKTDEPATSKLTLWPTGNPGDALAPVSDGGFKRDHSITATGLVKGTNYDFRIESSDATGNTVVSGALMGFVAKPGVVTKLVQPVGGGSSFFTNLQPDTQFPVILKGPHVVASTSTTLTVEWSTDESSDSGVGFGTDGLALRVEDGSDVLGHRVVLTNLDPNTAYQYQVESTDPAGNGATKSRVFLAKTAAAIDETPPRITVAPKVIYKTERQATITWKTDEGVQTFLEFGTEALNGQQSLPDFVTKHQVTLTNLTPETTYKYRVHATDAAGNGPAQSQDLTFITEGSPDRTAPQISVAPAAEAVTDISAVIKWQTDELSDSAVSFEAGENLSANALGLVAGSATDVLLHEVALTNLMPNTAYSFLVQSTDRSGNGPVSSLVVAFATAAGKDEIPPAIPTDVAVRGTNGQLVVSWTVSPDPDVAGYDVLRAVGDGVFSPVATLVPNPIYRDDGLSETIVYRYQVRALDAAGNQSELSTVVSASPDGTGLPAAPIAVGAEGDLTQPLLVVENAANAVNLVYTFEIASDEAFTQVVAQASGIAQGSGIDREGTTAWQVDTLLEKDATYYWRARAFDGVFDGPFMATSSFVAGGLQPVVNVGDFDGDLQVGFSDFIMFVSGFGTSEGQDKYQKVLDLDGSGQIGFSDFIAFAGVFGTRY